MCNHFYRYIPRIILHSSRCILLMILYGILIYLKFTKLQMQQKLSFKVINRDGINLNTKGELHNFLYPLAMLSSSTIFKVSQMCTTILRSLICKHVSSLQKKIRNHFINSSKILLVLLRILVTARYLKTLYASNYYTPEFDKNTQYVFSYFSFLLFEVYLFNMFGIVIKCLETHKHLSMPTKKK